MSDYQFFFHFKKFFFFNPPICGQQKIDDDVLYKVINFCSCRYIKKNLKCTHTRSKSKSVSVESENETEWNTNVARVNTQQSDSACTRIHDLYTVCVCLCVAVHTKSRQNNIARAKGESVHESLIGWNRKATYYTHAHTLHIMVLTLCSIKIHRTKGKSMCTRAFGKLFVVENVSFLWFSLSFNAYPAYTQTQAPYTTGTSIFSMHAHTVQIHERTNVLSADHLWCAIGRMRLHFLCCFVLLYKKRRDATHTANAKRWISLSFSCTYLVAGSVCIRWCCCCYQKLFRYTCLHT